MYIRGNIKVSLCGRLQRRAGPRRSSNNNNDLALHNLEAQGAREGLANLTQSGGPRRINVNPVALAEHDVRIAAAPGESQQACLLKALYESEHNGAKHSLQR